MSRIVSLFDVSFRLAREAFPTKPILESSDQNHHSVVPCLEAKLEKVRK